MVLMLSATVIAAQSVKPPEAAQNSLVKMNRDARLQTLVERAVKEARAKSPTLKDEELAVTLIDLTNASATNGSSAASYRGDVAIYPASVVKMFYMVAAHRQLQDGKLKLTPELERAMRDMIIESSNDATHYMVDALSDTTAGLELSEKEMQTWSYKRNAVNRFFAALGYDNINVAQKTWCESPYGRERAFVNDKAQSRVRGATNNRNALTTDATARLLAEIASGRAVSGERSKMMMDLMRRDFAGTTKDADDQAHGFTGLALTDEKYKAVKLWSKAGWTSTTRHDAAYLEMPNNKKFVLVTFTVNHANEREIIPTIARVVLDEMMK